MIMEQKTELHSAAKTIYQLSCDETVRWLAERTQDSLNHLHALEQMVQEKDNALLEKDMYIASLEEQIRELTK